MRRVAGISRHIGPVVATISALCSVAAGVHAQNAGAFSERGFGVRGIALGNAQVADAFGSGSPWYNPALAPLYSDQMIETAYTFLTNDRRLEYIQFAVPMKPRAGVAVGLIHAGVSDIDGRDDSGYHTETYSTDDYAAFLAFGSRVGSKATIGFAFRFFRSTLLPELSANSIGLQIGTTVQVRENLFVGASLDNILSRFEWDASDVLGSGQNSTDNFPIKLRVGVAYRLMEEKLTLLGEYESRFETVDVAKPGVDVIGGSPRSTTTLEEVTLHQSSFRAGAEYQVAELLLLRLGVDRIGDGAGGEMIPSAGFTLKYAVGELGTRFDYTFGKEAFGLGTFHLIGIRFYI
ncbi:MAG: PorV/PorQ family protein [Rhodothermia bacterium]